VVIIDDVITAGTSVGESVAAIRAAGATPHAVVIALDRCERAGDSALSAAQQVRRDTGMPVYSIIDLHDLVDYLGSAGGGDGAGPGPGQFAAITAYRDRYGAD